MSAETQSPQTITLPARREGTVFAILIAISICHFLNDLVQSLVPAVYPILKQSFGLDFGQVGLITLTFQLTASLMQPVVGLYTDLRPLPYSLPLGMGSTLVGLLLLSVAPSFGIILLAAALIGLGSSVFHPRSPSSRSVATAARRSGHCLRRSSSCRTGKSALPGFRRRRCLRSRF